MNALTIYQPWASLISIGAKRFVALAWDSEYRGPIAIHAGGGDPEKPYYERPRIVNDNMTKALLKTFPARGELPINAVVAIAELVGCWKIHHPSIAGSNLDMPIIFTRRNSHGSYYEHIGEAELQFGDDFSPGRFAWEFENVKMLDCPIPAKGRQGLWEWDGEELLSTRVLIDT